MHYRVVSNLTHSMSSRHVSVVVRVKRPTKPVTVGNTKMLPRVEGSASCAIKLVEAARAQMPRSQSHENPEDCEDLEPGRLGCYITISYC